MKDALQTVRFGKSANEPKTRFEQANEDRLNENFRLLQEKDVLLQEKEKSLQAAIDNMQNDDPPDTKRQCSKQITGSGWFRVLTYEAGNSAEAQGAVGFVIDMTIGKDGINSEAHKVSLFGVYGEVAFVDEVSVSATQLIDKIRYTYENSSPYSAYVDIHLSANPQSVISVDFSVKTKPSYQGLFKALSLDSVANTPSGETVLVEENLNANTGTSGAWSEVIQKTGNTPVPLPNDWTELYYNLRDDNSFGFSGTILKSSMLNASEYYWVGWYHTSDDNAYGYLQVGADFIKTAALVHNNSSTLSDSKLRVQYKT